VWGSGLEAQALQQMANAARLPVAVAGALMPDAHVGYGLPDEDDGARPDRKPQIPDPKSQRDPKFQIATEIPTAPVAFGLGSGIWDLVGIWDLGFGIWDLNHFTLKPSRGLNFFPSF
jgi:hypothetical protein